MVSQVYTYMRGVYLAPQRKSMQLSEPVVKMNCTNGCDCTQERQPRKLIRDTFSMEYMYFLHGAEREKNNGCIEHFLF